MSWRCPFRGGGPCGKSTLGGAAAQLDVGAGEPSGGADVEEDGEVVESAAGEDEEVPDGVAEGETLPGVEGDAGGVGEAAGEEVDESAGIDGADEGADGDDDQPPHEGVEGE